MKGKKERELIIFPQEWNISYPNDNNDGKATKKMFYTPNVLVFVITEMTFIKKKSKIKKIAEQSLTFNFLNIMVPLFNLFGTLMGRFSAFGNS